jgi:predicted RNA-binding protein with PIN domain
MRLIHLLALLFAVSCQDITPVQAALNPRSKTTIQATKFFKECLVPLERAFSDGSQRDGVSIVVLPSKRTGNRADEAIILVEDVFRHLAADEDLHTVHVVTSDSKQQLNIGLATLVTSVRIFGEDLETIEHFLRKGTPFASRSSASVRYVTLYTVGSNATVEANLKNKLKEVHDWLPRNST